MRFLFVDSLLFILEFLIIIIFCVALLYYVLKLFRCSIILGISLVPSGFQEIPHSQP